MARFKVKAKLFWPSLDKPNDLSGKYQVDIGQLSDAAVEHMQKQGIEARNKDDERGNFVTVKSQHPIQPYDKEGDKVTELIGNETGAEVLVQPFSWNFKGKEGKSLSCVKLIVTDLVIYESVDEIDDSLEEAL